MTKEELLNRFSDEVTLEFRDVIKSVITFEGTHDEGINEYNFIAMARTDKRDFDKIEYFDMFEFDEVQVYMNGELVYTEGNV